MSESAIEQIKQIFEEELEEQKIQGVNKDVLFAWNTIKNDVLQILGVEKQKLQELADLLKERGFEEHYKKMKEMFADFGVESVKDTKKETKP